MPEVHYLPIGARVTPEGIYFRVWAPRASRVSVVFEPPAVGCIELKPEELGYFGGLATEVGAGARYYYRLDGASGLWPDPASCFQPAGCRGPSQVVDLSGFEWHDATWPGVSLDDAVLYEMHVGTFAREGTWRAATAELAELAALGVTVLELMPIAEFPGRFGWSYDGANLFAPTHLYGTPDDLCAFIDEAHRVGLGVILDVVYNHLGQVGEALLRPFSEDYFSRRYPNEWGSAINFDDDGSASVREFMLANARLWIGRYHFDGMRLDATQAFFDSSPKHIVAELASAARTAAPERRVLVVAENEPQRAELMAPVDAGGAGIDAMWNDDFHHAATVRLTGHGEAYYTDYRGSAEEFVAGAKWGYLFQGQRYSWQRHSRGSPALWAHPRQFVNYLQNHDQVANSADGLRTHALSSPGRWRAMTALLLLGPQTPLIFQGQEFAASTPFFYFNDAPADEAESVRQGRARFLSQFRSLATAQMQERLVDPCDEATFERSRLELSERGSHPEAYALHRDLLRLRRDEQALRVGSRADFDATTLGPDALAIRYLADGQQARLLVVNLDRDLRRPSIAEPLVAPPAGYRWNVAWSSEDPRYGGNGTPAVDTDEGWFIPGESAILFHPIRMDPSP